MLSKEGKRGLKSCYGNKTRLNHTFPYCFLSHFKKNFTKSRKVAPNYTLPLFPPLIKSGNHQYLTQRSAPCAQPGLAGAHRHPPGQADTPRKGAAPARSSPTAQPLAQLPEPPRTWWHCQRHVRSETPIPAPHFPPHIHYFAF